ncbi:hypothetical protein GCM10025857_08490 [Alicyclobacillus contaminans]|uniref:phosphatase PAP2 family protein n=1 Tax=Alicyclobacillus contaminans TaxID=392016 RepID=UPI0003F9B6E7|nr:phosphatase PAP2 family protein [Alicyclobacillus contaminans]GMA49492.1 hypothetical protein GCM10025857_08490 [Alicyclobacillus contaminans]
MTKEVLLARHEAVTEEREWFRRWIHRLHYPFGWELRISEFCHVRWDRIPLLTGAMAVAATYTPISMMGLIVLTSLWSQWTGAWPGAIQHGLIAVLAAVLARGLNEPLSRVVARPRPFEILGFRPLVDHDGGEAFPSNHATGAFALALSMSGVPGLSGIFVTLAIVLCLSRVYAGVHTVTDVCAGALHGSAVALLVNGLVSATGLPLH